MLVTAIYFVNALVALCVAYAAIDPAGCRSALERLGLWPLVQRLDQRRTRRLLGAAGKLLMLAAAILALSVMAGRHSTAWLLPAAQAAFFGLLAWFVSTLDGRD